MKKPEEGTQIIILEGETTKEKADMLMHAWNHANYYISLVKLV